MCVDVGGLIVLVHTPFVYPRVLLVASWRGQQKILLSCMSSSTPQDFSNGRSRLEGEQTLKLS